MKREYESENDESEDEKEQKRRRVEHDILRDLHVNLKNEDEIDKRLFESQKQYTTTYIYKLLKQMPMGEKLAEIVQDKQNDFEYMFTVAKSLVESTNYMRKMKSMYGVVDMLYEIGFRYVHEKIVTPSLSNVVSKEHCDRAYEKYAENNEEKNDDALLELQCLLYCTQETIEKNTTVRIQNPLYTRMTAQMKGMSDYVIGLLMGSTKSKTTELVLALKSDGDEIPKSKPLDVNDFKFTPLEKEEEDPSDSENENSDEDENPMPTFTFHQSSPPRDIK